MRNGVLLLLIALGLVALGFVALPTRRWWRRQLMGYYIGRVQSHLGFGTSWLVWLLIAGLESRGRTAEALTMAKMIRLTAPVRDPVLLHLEILRGLREQAASMKVDGVAFERFLSEVDREALRREIHRILFFHEPDITVELIDRLEGLIQAR